MRDNTLYAPIRLLCRNPKVLPSDGLTESTSPPIPLRWNSGKTANGATLRDVTDWVSLSIFTSVSKIYQTICFSVIFLFLSNC